MTLTCSQPNRDYKATVSVVLNLYTDTITWSFIGVIIKFYALVIYNVSCISRLSYPP
jgi:hypothetical protein